MQHQGPSSPPATLIHHRPEYKTPGVLIRQRNTGGANKVTINDVVGQTIEYTAQGRMKCEVVLMSSENVRLGGRHAIGLLYH